MSVFAYNPEAAKAWANSVVNYLDGGAESVNACSKKFNEQLEKLVQPNVWTGPAALKNYQDFLTTHNALVSFVNKFGEAFEEAMNSVNQSVSNLEVSNAGGTGNSIASTFGTLSFDQLSELSSQNIDTGVVRYDYATISSIGSELNSILSSLESIKTSLSSKIGELNNGNAVWDGTAAESAKETLNNTLSTGMAAVMEPLNVCISNISAAAEAAQMADTGR